MCTVHLLQLSSKLKHYAWFWFGPRWSSCVSRSGGGYYGLGVKETWFRKHPKVLPIQALHDLIWEFVVLMKLSLLDHHRFGALQLAVYSNTTLCRMCFRTSNKGKRYLPRQEWFTVKLPINSQIRQQSDLSSLNTNVSSETSAFNSLISNFQFELSHSQLSDLKDDNRNSLISKF